MSETITLKITPIKEVYYNNETSFGTYAFTTNDSVDLKMNSYKNYSLKGKTMRLQVDQEYNATVVETFDKKYGYGYEIKSIYQDIPSDIEKQKIFLSYILTKEQVKNIYKVYPDQDIIQLIKEGRFDYRKVKRVGEVTFEKIRDKIIENTELHQAIEFLGKYDVSHNMLIKLVKHFNSASLLIQEMQNNPYCITEVSGIGFKKADVIAMNMKYDPRGEFRIVSAIEYVVEEESNNGHTYIEVFDAIEKVYELINVDSMLIAKNVKDTKKIIRVDDKLALKKNYQAEKYITKRIKGLLEKSNTLNFNPEEFVKRMEEKHGITLSEQQRAFFNNVRDCNFHVLVGYAGTGKSQLIKFLIELLEEIGIRYRMLSPTGKAGKVLSNYTKRSVETIHRALASTRVTEDEEESFIEEEYIIADEMSMSDAQLTAQLLYKCNHKRLRVLFIGDSFQLASVGSGNILHDLIESNSVPMTKLDVVFRQKEGGILDIATKIRKKEKFVENDYRGVKKFGNNCVLVSVPQEKMVVAYQHYLKEVLKKYSVEDVTIVTPTKKGDLGTAEINRHVQEIVNPKVNGKKEKEFGFDKTIFREGDLIINTKNSYGIENVNKRNVNIVNGDIGTIECVDETEMIIDFEFDRIPIEIKQLDRLLHAWCMTMHKMQGSANKVVIAILDKSHKFQLNANLLYVACTRPEDFLIIITQADTLNFAMRKVANLQRNTFLCDMLKEEHK